MVEVLNIPAGKSFTEWGSQSPCEGCSASCCKMLLIHYPAPATFMEMDHLRYMLGFPGIKMLLRNDGQWQVKVEQTCGQLDESNRCKVHGTADKPKTCSHYNETHCWYKRNYATEDKPDLVEMDSQGLNRLLELIRFDERGDIQQIPTWEQVRALFA